jgi:hypothetical protein
LRRRHFIEGLEQFSAEAPRTQRGEKNELPLSPALHLTTNGARSAPYEELRVLRALLRK